MQEEQSILDNSKKDMKWDGHLHIMDVSHWPNIIIILIIIIITITIIITIIIIIISAREA